MRRSASSLMDRPVLDGGTVQYRIDHFRPDPLGPLIAGLLAVALGGYSVAAAIMVCFALLSVVAMLMGRETKGSELPH